MWISILISILGSDTLKLLGKRAIAAVRTRVDTSIDPELAETLLNDIVGSDGNKLTREITDKLIKEL